MHHVWWMDLEYCTYSQYHNFNGLIGIHGSLVYFVILLNVFVISNELCHLLRLFQYLSPLICDTFIHQYPFTHTPDACTYPPMYVYTVYIHGCTFNSKTMITVWNSVVICFSFIWVCVLFHNICVWFYNGWVLYGSLLKIISITFIWIFIDMVWNHAVISSLFFGTKITHHILGSMVGICQF